MAAGSEIARWPGGVRGAAPPHYSIRRPCHLPFSWMLQVDWGQALGPDPEGELQHCYLVPRKSSDSWPV